MKLTTAQRGVLEILNRWHPKVSVIASITFSFFSHDKGLQERYHYREGIKPSTIAKLLKLGAIKGRKKKGRNEQFYITQAGRRALKPAPPPAPAGKPREED